MKRPATNMDIRGIFLLLCVGIALHNGGFSFSGERITADERFRIAMQQLGRVSVEESIRALKEVLALDESHIRAYVELAELYMSLNTPLDRQSAEKLLRRAIRLDPENVEHRVFLGDLMWAQGHMSNAKRQYEAVLAQDPRNAEAAFGLGLYYTKDFMKYWNMIDTEGNSHSVTLEWRHFARDSRERAIRNLRQCVQHDPGFKDAYFQLGLIYMEEIRSAPAAAGRALVNVANSMLKAYQGDKDALLFVGLGYHTSGYLDNAWDFYVRALERMSVEERSIIESVEAVAEDEELTRVAKADSLAKKAGGGWVESSERVRFWRKQDPLLLTERNERRMEHYRRVAYANLRFSKLRRGIAGWRTEMGRVYIKFGDPLGRTVTRPEVDERGRRTVQAHTELWAYEGFSFRFRNWNGLDAWRFAEGTPSIPYGEWVHKRTPQRYKDPYRKLKYSLPYQVAAFRDAGKMRLEVTYAISKDRLRISDVGTVDLQDGLFLYDGDWEMVSRAVYATRRLADVGTDSVRGRYLLSKSTLIVEPGDYNLIAEVQDRSTRTIGTFRDTYEFAMEDSSAAMSDLLVATDIEMDDPFPARREDLRLLLNPLHTFYRTESLYIYFEVYNLTRDDFGRTKYEITYGIGQPEEADVTLGRFEAVGLAEPPGRVRITIGKGDVNDRIEMRANYLPAERNLVSRTTRRFDGDVGETAVAVRYEGERADEFTYLQIELRAVPEGYHELTVRLKDLNNELQGDERSVLFRVIG
ncbi:MAG: GWxTD domain-containing protein [Gemmatimonadetes bacterium]|nr:GWxTD domain-containing protein [Gemmatimonadota bacterium]